MTSLLQRRKNSENRSAFGRLIHKSVVAHCFDSVAWFFVAWCLDWICLLYVVEFAADIPDTVDAVAV